MSTCNVDVAVVGGGPAGAAAALTLLKYSPLQVALLERSDYRQPRVGETVPPSLQPLLGYLGVWEHFVAEGHLPAYGTSAAWGGPEILSRDFLFTGRGDGWHLDRRRFDAMLADEVAAHGGTLLTAARVVAGERDAAGRWRLGVAHEDGWRSDLTAGFVVDASGKKAAMARRLGARQRVYDHLMSVIGFYEFADERARPHFTLVESVADGWWYSALLPGSRMVVALMSDVDVVRRRRARDPESWQAMLEATRHTGLRLAGGRLCLPLQARPAYSQLLEPAAGPGWVAAGDAASSFDPLASMGIGHAVASGIHAARAAHDVLTSDGSLMAQYTAGLARNFQNYLELRRQYYQIEQRWPDQPFWARRHARS